MVRRDEPKQLKGSGGSGCTSPAGESPAPVIAGEPGSRSTAHTEMGAAEAGRRKPLRREHQRVRRGGSLRWSRRRRGKARGHDRNSEAVQLPREAEADRQSATPSKPAEGSGQAAFG